MIIHIGLLLASLVAASPVVKVASSESAPNPISHQYPQQVINGTIAVIPIPYSLARSIIPAKYRILTGAYQSLLGSALPANTYPLVVRTGLDHDVRIEAAKLTIPDFQTAHIRFPFIDLLGDGHSNFAWEKYLPMSNNPAAVSGAADYGLLPIPATFDPQLESYKTSGPGRISFTVWSSPSVLALSTNYDNSPAITPFPLDFYKKTTNQPSFGNGTTCDQQITLFDTVLSTGGRAPSGVVGDVVIKSPFLDGQDHTSQGVHGIKVDVAFIENNYLDCRTLKGF